MPDAPHTPGPSTRTIILVIGLTAVLVCGIIAWRIVAVMDRALPTAVVSEKTTLFVSSVKSEAKFVVATQTLRVSVTRSEAYYALWMYWGTTVASIAVDDCKVQYMIPTQNITTDDFHYDKDSRLLIANLPRPVLDDEFVDIPTDESKWTKESSSGWARFNKGDMENMVQQSLRAEVLRAARTKGFDEQTQAVAIMRLKKVLADFYQIPDLHVDVTFR